MSMFKLKILKCLLQQAHESFICYFMCWKEVHLDLKFHVAILWVRWRFRWAWLPIGYMLLKAMLGSHPHFDVLMFSCVRRLDLESDTLWYAVLKRFGLTLGLDLRQVVSLGIWGHLFEPNVSLTIVNLNPSCHSLISSNDSPWA